MQIDWIIRLHVVAGLLWVLSTLATAVTERAAKWLLVLQVSAALTSSLAGIALWHVLHAGLSGPREHMLAVGTFCALIAIGPQAAIIVPTLVDKEHKGTLEGAALLLYRVSDTFLMLAAAAMTYSVNA